MPADLRAERVVLRLVMAQCNLLVGDIPANTELVIESAQRARDELGADLIVFSELTLTGYPPEDLLLCPGLQELVDAGLARIRSEVSAIQVLVGHPEQTPEGRYNPASLVDGGRVVARCRKHHLPNYSVFDEKRYFVAGDGFCVADVAGVPVAVTICEDIWTPESARAAVDAGARLLVNLNASPFHTGKGNEREAVVAMRVQETACPVVYVNLVGGQDELVFDGGSFVLDQSATTVVRAPAYQQGL